MNEKALQIELDEIQGEVNARIQRVEAISKFMNWVDPDLIWESISYESLVQNLGEILEDDVREIKGFFVG